VECGYVQIGRKASEATTSSDLMVYSIMFGPNKRGYIKGAQLTSSYLGKDVPKKSDLPYLQEGKGTSHLCGW